MGGPSREYVTAMLAAVVMMLGVCAFFLVTQVGVAVHGRPVFDKVDDAPLIPTLPQVENYARHGWALTSFGELRDVPDDCYRYSAQAARMP